MKNISSNIKNIFIALPFIFLILCIGLWLSLSVPVIYKMGILFIPAIMVLLVSVNPLTVLNFIFLLRPELDLFHESGLLKFFTGMVLIFALFVLISRKKINYCWSRLKYFYFFILIAISGLVYTINYSSSFVFILKVFSFVSIYLLVFNLIQKKEDGIKLLSFFPLCSIVPLLYGFYQYFTGQTYTMDRTDISRFSSFFPLANVYSQFLFIILITSIPLLVYKKGGKKILIAALLASTITLAMLSVRTTWIGLAISVLLLTKFFPQYRKSLLITILAVFLVSAPKVIKGVEEVVNPNDLQVKNTSSFNTRLTLWQLLFTKVVGEQIFLGSGVGTAEEMATVRLHIPLMPHNDYLRILVDTGLVGFIPYMTFLFSTLIYFYRGMSIYAENKLLNACAFIALISIMVMMIAENMFYYTCVIWYLLGFLALVHKFNVLSGENL